LTAHSAAAAIHTVTVNEAFFSPSLLTIAAGDTVIWENVDTFFPHTTISDLPSGNANYWTGLMVGEGDTFEHTFNNVGTFTYHDNQGSGQGTITVTAPPAAGIVLAAPRTVGNQFYFDATGLTVGKTNVLQASTNLTSWVAIKTNVANNAAATFTNTMTLPKRFFRLLEQP
jgi:plastocyanin